MFARQRDVSLIRHINRELMGNVITQQAAFYQFKLEETKVNIYGEAADEKYYNGLKKYVIKNKTYGLAFIDANSLGHLFSFYFYIF